jgi:hypothetical protein
VRKKKKLRSGKQKQAVVHVAVNKSAIADGGQRLFLRPVEEGK